jgi:PAS domain S-box-containing protein
MPIQVGVGIMIETVDGHPAGLVKRPSEKGTRDLSPWYGALLDTAPDAMVISNASGLILLINKQTECLFGYSRDELVGQPADILVSRQWRDRHSVSHDDYMPFPRTLLMGEVRDLLGLRKDGSVFAMDTRVSPIETPEGLLISTAIRDVTERKSVEQALRASERRLRGILDSAPDAVVIADATGSIVLVNLATERLFGHSREELVGRSLEMLIPARFRGAHSQHRRRYTAHPRIRSLGQESELRGLHKGGGEFPVEIMLSPLDSADGTLITAVIRDITDRKRAEANLLNMVGELRRSNEELQQFANVASHDLQEPLRMVSSYTQLLAERYKGRLDADADEFIGFAVDGSKRMQGLIQDLLVYAHVGTGSHALVRMATEEALAAALVDLRAAIEDSGAVITHDPLPTIDTEASQVTRVLQNLIGNAIKYRRPGVPRVHVSARDSGSGEWIFAVRDNGIGIEPQYFEKIFVIFQRLHRREEFEGTGIGLAICKKALERLGGRIWLESQPGVGSTFYFAVPKGGPK